MSTITEMINSHQGTAFSFEVLPPLKGNGTGNLFRTIEQLREFNPLYINITSHRSEYVYHNLEEDWYSVSVCADVLVR